MDPMSLMLFGLLGVMLVFMFVNTRKRQKQMKEQQEEKATKTVPGVKVLLQGGLYGTIVSYDPDNLDQPAIVELAPGVEIKVHSQAILRIVSPTDGAVSEDEYLAAEESHAEYAEGVANGDISSISDDQHAGKADDAEPDADSGTKPRD